MRERENRSTKRFFFNLLLLFSSIGLHGLFSPKTLPALALHILLARFFGGRLTREGETRTRWLAAGYASHVLGAMLLRYAAAKIPFFGDSAAESSLLFIGREHLLSAFLLLHALSYLSEAYKKERKKGDKLFDIALYLSALSFLPIRPLLSHRRMKEQMEEGEIKKEGITRGIYRLAIGTAKKVVLAESFALIADTVFLMSRAGHLLLEIPLLLSWIGLFSFALQMFYTFSAYTDLAAGFLSLFGFEPGEAFGFPYGAASPGAYWMKWQHSVKSFFYRQGLLLFEAYAKKKNEGRFYAYILSGTLFGLWFGFGLRFVLWGFFFSLILALEDLMLGADREESESALLRLLTPAAALFGWLIIRTENHYHFKEYFGNLFLQNGNGIYNAYVWMFIREYRWLWIIGIAGCADPARYRKVFFRLLRGGREDPPKTFAAAGALQRGIKSLQKAVWAGLLAFVSLLYIFGGGMVKFRLPGRIRYSVSEGYGGLQRLLGKQEMKGFAVVRDRKGILYESSFWNGFGLDARALARGVRNLDESEKGTRLGMVIYPTKLFWKENGYEGIPYRDDTEAAEEIKAWMHYYGIPVLDLQFMGRDEAAAGVDFMNTDEDWSPRGAFKGYVHILSWMEESYGLELDPKNRLKDIASYEVHTYEAAVLGTQGKKTGLCYAGRADDYMTIEPLHSGSYTARYENKEGFEERSGDFKKALMRDAGLDAGRALYNMAFKESYLGGNQYKYVSILNHEEKEGKSLLLIKDSHAAPVGAFLAQSFGRVDLLEASLLERGEIKEFLESRHYDYVLITLGAKQLVETELEF